MNKPKIKAPVRPYCVRLDQETRDLIRELAEMEDRREGAIIRRAIRAYLVEKDAERRTIAERYRTVSGYKVER